MESEKIVDIRKKFMREWLLIAVDEMDKATTKPISGRLLAHSPNPQEIVRKSLNPYKGLMFIDYSERQIPKMDFSFRHAQKSQAV